MYPLEVKDVEQIPAEKIVAAKIGSNSDNYLHHAINNMRCDLLVYLLKEVPGIDFHSRNSQGQTLLHLAIKSGSIGILKTLCLANHSNLEQLLKTSSVNDMKGNINTKIVKLLSMQNNKGQTPLLICVEMANFEMFKFLFDLMIHLQTTQGKCQILTD